MIHSFWRQYAPDSWLAILRSVTDEERICTSPLSRKMRPSVTYLSCESRVFPRGFLMVKFSTYFSRGSSRDPIFPSSHSLYSISVGKIFDTLAILQRQRETQAVGWMSHSHYSCSGSCGFFSSRPTVWASVKVLYTQLGGTLLGTGC